jgi:hypothetical protein
MLRFCAAAVLTIAPLAAQKFPIELDWSKLAAKAVEKSEITLDESMLGLASQFMNLAGDQAKGKEKEMEQAKLVLKGLKAIHVRNYEFAKEGDYSPSDVEAIQKAIETSGWKKIVSSVERNGETSGVYLNTDGTAIKGLIVLAAERKELSVVQIIGEINPNQLASLGGVMGIPKMEFNNAGNVKLKDKEKTKGN